MSLREPTVTVLLFVALCASAANAEESTSATSFVEYAEPGPFPIGVQTVVFVDDSRADPYSGGPRTLVTDIWYPAVDAAKGSPATDFVGFFRGHEDGARQFVEFFGGTLAGVNRRFVCKAVRAAALRAGRFPLLVFSHGNGGVRQQNVFQVEHLASHGYLVASPDHTGNAGITPLDGRYLPYDRSRGSRARSSADRPQDVRFLIDRILSEAEEATSWLHGAVDADAIGALGHSFGGYTACRAAEIDSRIRAIVPMTVALGSKPGKTPILLMLGRLDQTVGAAGNVVASVYWNDCTGPRYLLTLTRGGHFSFSDMDRINPRFGDGIGTYEKDGKTGEFLDSQTTKRIINTYTLAFFDGYLAQDRRALELLKTNVLPHELDLVSTPRDSARDAKTPDQQAETREAQEDAQSSAAPEMP